MDGPGVDQFFEFLFSRFRFPEEAGKPGEFTSGSRPYKMKSPMAAHLRRICATLEWISRHRPESAVTFRGEKIGSWQAVEPAWRAAGGEVRLRFSRLGRAFSYPVASVRSEPGAVRLRLSVPGKPMPELLSIVWQGEEAPPVPFPQIAAEWAKANHPDSSIRSIAGHSDRAHSLSGSYLRIRFKGGSRTTLLLFVPPDPTAEVVQSALSQSLLWAILLHARGQAEWPARIRILAPAGSSGVLCHRARFLDRNRIQVDILEYSIGADGSLQVSMAPEPVLPVEDRDFRWPVLGPFRWSPLLGQVLDLAPGAIRRYPRFQDYDSLRLAGLEFARAAGRDRDRIEFGIAGQSTELTDDTFPGLAQLVGDILYYRRADGPCVRHPYYRMQAERWLESMILDEAPRLFPELAPESVYPQIPVYLGKAPGRVDILGVDREGRLVVMELKVAADPDLPLQALDYWGRVIHHNLNGDFERRGYFSGMELDRRPPRIYLVSPVFCFHDKTERILEFVDSSIEVWKIQVNEDWRSGVVILNRIRLRCGN